MMSAVALFSVLFAKRRLPDGLVVCLLLLALPAWAQQGTEPVTASDLLKIQELDDVTLSPDRRTIVYTVKQIVEKPEEDGQYEYRTQLFMVPASGREAPHQLTYGEESASQPAWHPDGDRLAFVRAVDGKPQIFVLPLYGGEAYQLTDIEHGASRPRWSPDGSKILFSTSLPADAVRQRMARGPEWPDERPGGALGDTSGVAPDPTGSLPEIRAWLAENADKDGPRVFNRLDLQGELDLEPQPSFQHFFVVEARREAEPRALTSGYYSFGGGEWLPDGNRIVLSGAPDPSQHPDRVQDSDLYLADTTDRLTRLLSLDGYALHAPQVAPDGQHLTFLARDLNDSGYAQTELGLYSFDGSMEPKLLTQAFDRAVDDVKWSPEGWHLYFTAASDGGFPLYRIPVFDAPAPSQAPVADSIAALLRGADSLAVDSLMRAARQVPADTAFASDTLSADALMATDTLAADVPAVDSLDEPTGPPIERLTGFARGVRSFDISSASVFYVLTEPTNPYELYAAGLTTGEERRLTSHNAAWLANKRLSVPEPHTLRRDSLTIQYWTMKPAPFEAEREYPLLLEIHGGPMAMWGPGEATMWHEFQFFASHGYGIVFANPRGSGGYGHAFKRLNYQDWGAGPAGDVLAAATEAAQLPWIDPDRQVVTGGSYAGYLTAWIVGHDDRFKAAVAQRGVYDLVTFLGEGNAWRLVPYHFGGYPWKTNEASLTAASGDTPDLPMPAEQEEVVGLGLMIDQLADDIAWRLVPQDSVGAGAAADTAAATDTAAVPTSASVREILLRESPLTYADQINTPLLIMHSDNDLRTGVIQSEMLYKTLKILDKPVEYVRYPDSGHDLSRTGDPRLRMDRLLRIYEFFERFIDHDAGAPPPAADTMTN